LRNALVVGVSDAVIAVGGSWGTLNEITLAMKNKTPTIVIGGWKVDDLCHAAEESFHRATSAEQAVAKALELAARRKTWVEHGDNA
jgi:predicted Rossmann-fold nucleotide-binding protein